MVLARLFMLMRQAALVPACTGNIPGSKGVNIVKKRIKEKKNQQVSLIAAKIGQRVIAPNNL